jgi:hypothetical protein
MCVHCIIPFGYLRKLFVVFPRCHKNLRTLHKHNGKNNEGVWGEMEKPSVSTCSGFFVSFSAIICFSVVLSQTGRRKSFCPANIFPRVSRRQSANCYVIFYFIFLLDAISMLRHDVKLRDAIGFRLSFLLRY